MKIKDTITELKSEAQGLFRLENATFVLFLVFSVGILMTETARAVGTIGWVGLVVISLFNIKKDQVDLLKKYKFVLLLCGVFFLNLVYGFFTDFENNADYLKGRLMIKLPFLLLPLTLFFLPKLSLKQIQAVFYAFFIGVVVIAIKASVYYFGHAEEVAALYRQSKTLPLPLNHVRFSLMLSLSIFFGVYFVWKKVSFFKAWERYLNIVLTSFLFIFLHVLSVRSGLLSFYAIISFVILIISIRYKKLWVLVSSGVVMALFLFVSYKTVGSFKAKVENTIEDLNYTKYEYYANFHSLTGRVFSYKVAGKLIKENPVFGVGIGNLDSQVKRKYITEYSEIVPNKRLKPHNQFLSYTVAFGVFGVVLFCGFMYGLLYYRELRRSWFIVVPFLLVTISFLFENTLETQLGTNFTIFTIILPVFLVLKSKKEERDDLLHF